MICGTRVIATNTRGPRELIENNKNGFLVEINDYKNTAKSIEKIYTENIDIDNLKNQITSKTTKYLLSNVLKQLDSYYELV